MAIQRLQNRLTLILIVFFAGMYTADAQTVKPQFKGGEDALGDYVRKKSKMTIVLSHCDSEAEDVEGRISFLVGKTGKISSISVSNSKNKEICDNAIKIVRSMPVWKPGKINGVATPMYDTLCIFKQKIFTAPPVTGKASDEHDYEDRYNDGPKVEAEPASTESYKEKPLFIVDQMPGYNGGNEAMMAFIKDNLQFPSTAPKGIEGRILVRFVVTKDGTIDDVKVIRGLHPEYDKEAVRVVKAMPKWIPGRHNGLYVPVYFTLPIFIRPKQSSEQ